MQASGLGDEVSLIVRQYEPVFKAVGRHKARELSIEEYRNPSPGFFKTTDGGREKSLHLFPYAQRKYKLICAFIVAFPSLTQCNTLLV